MRRPHPLVLLPLAATLLSGCSTDRPEDGLIALLVGSVLAILLLGFCGMAVYTGALAAGAINIRINLKQPTTKSKRWGFVWGVLNVLGGAVGVWLIYLMATNPDPESADGGSWLIVLVGTLAAFAIGAGALWAAARAAPAPRTGR